VWNNLGFAAAAGVVLVGTIYPLLVEASGAGLISVGPPYFNAAVMPILALLLAALPIAPLLTWRSADLRIALQRLWPAAAIAALTLLAALLRGPVWAAVGLALGAWLIAGGGVYLVTRAQRGEGRTLAKLAALPLAAWAMSLAHFGAGALTLGAVAETGFRRESAAVMAPGQAIDFAGRNVRLLAMTDAEGPNYYATRATFRVGAHQTLIAERRFYPVAGQPTTEVAIASAWDGDLYIALGDIQRDGSGAYVRFYHNPFVGLIFAGAALMALGGALSLAALARRRRAAP
jgi:cytochrome c-type biogenesis protein CcmF